MDIMPPVAPLKNMGLDTFHAIIDWLLQTYERKPVHLLGGEPTLHPEFEYVVSYLLEKDFPIRIFTNLATPQALVCSEKLSIFRPVDIGWVVNVGEPASWASALAPIIEQALKYLGKHASLVANILPESKDERWTLDLIKKHNLNKRIKIGLVLPTVSASNYYLDDEAYKVVCEKVVRLAIEAEKEDVHLDFECGVPTCVFTEEQLGILWGTGSTLASHCDSRMDINPDGECMYCLPLATRHPAHFSTFKNYPEAKNWFENKLAPFRNIGRTIECHSCNLMRPGSCNGGCLANMFIGARNT
jgi:radical SAM protein with 4Fe4S-binding SPASM domain